MRLIKKITPNITMMIVVYEVSVSPSGYVPV